MHCGVFNWDTRPVWSLSNQFSPVNYASKWWIWRWRCVGVALQSNTLYVLAHLKQHPDVHITTTYPRCFWAFRFESRQSQRHRIHTAFCFVFTSALRKNCLYRLMHFTLSQLSAAWLKDTTWETLQFKVKRNLALHTVDLNQSVTPEPRYVPNC